MPQKILFEGVFVSVDKNSLLYIYDTLRRLKQYFAQYNVQNSYWLLQSPAMSRRLVVVYLFTETLHESKWGQQLMNEQCIKKWINWNKNRAKHTSKFEWKVYRAYKCVGIRVLRWTVSVFSWERSAADGTAIKSGDSRLVSLFLFEIPIFIFYPKHNLQIMLICTPTSSTENAKSVPIL